MTKMVVSLAYPHASPFVKCKYSNCVFFNTEVDGEAAEESDSDNEVAIEE